MDRPDVQLLVERLSPAGTRSFHTMSLDGRFASPLENVPGDAIRLFPSPDGNSLAWLRDHDDLVHLWLMDRDGDNRRPLLDDERVVAHVAWSPDGSRLLVAGSTLNEPDDIWVINANGSGLTNLTPDPKPAVYSDLSPSWSPDGARIAFVSNRSGMMRLWTMNATGQGPAQVYPAGEYSARFAAWSPSGIWIAFVGATPDGSGIGVVRPDGTGFRFFTASGDIGSIAWLPDGRVMYSSAAGGDFEIYALEIVNGTSENLTNHAEHDVRATLLPRGERAAWRGLSLSQSIASGIDEPPGLAAGDVIADGFPEVIVPDPENTALRLYRNVSGTLQPLGTLDAFADVARVASADITDDGVEDIVATRAGSFALYRGSAGGPGLAEVHDLDGSPRAMALWDPEGDGSPAVAFIVDRPMEDYRVRVHAANGEGEIIALIDGQTEFDRPTGACIGDVTGGGYPDVVVTTARAAHSIVLHPVQGVSFGEPVIMASGLGLLDATRPICADFDGDQRTDLALITPGVRGISLHLSLGSGLANPATLDVVGDDAIATDVDRDGDVDLLVASTDAANILFLRNLGDGRFASPVSQPLPQRATRLVAVDLDRDGWRDLVAHSAQGLLMVLRNQRRSASP